MQRCKRQLSDIDKIFTDPEIVLWNLDFFFFFRLTDITPNLEFKNVYLCRDSLEGKLEYVVITVASVLDMIFHEEENTTHLKKKFSREI